VTLRTVLVWSIAASIFAGCSGGAGSVPTSASHVDTPNAAVSLRLDASQFEHSSTARNGRSPSFIGTSVTQLAYSFTPGPIAATIALSTCAVQTGPPKVYTCTIGLPANTYAVTLTLENGATPIGTGSATGIAVAPNATTPLSVNINPINSGPTLAVTGSPSQFYVDGHAQTISTSLNELDPAGNIISTYYGPVSNFPTLTLSDSGGTTGVTLNGGTTTFATVPSTQAGLSASIAYNGSGANATSLGLSVSDGTTPSNTVTIPYISLGASAGSIQFVSTGAGGALTATFSETSSTGGSPVLDTVYTNTTTCAVADVVISPFVTSSLAVPPLTNQNPTTAGAITYTFTANDVTFSPCTMTVVSANDPNLSATLTIKPSGGAGVIISSHATR
jgi:hypothetical protein